MSNLDKMNTSIQEPARHKSANR